MQNGNQGFGGTRWRSLLVAAVATVGTLWTSVAMATITQGDFSVFGFFETRESAQWGQGSSSRDSTPTTYYRPTATAVFVHPGTSFGMTGGSFDFNHWDLAEARQLADVRPDYHMIKNYKLLGRFDTLFIKDADFFAYYRPWYDAYGSIKNTGRQRPNTDVVPYNSGNPIVPTMQDEFFKNDLREYYAQLNFTDNFSARIGKQQVIWTEADALSGTEVTNPVNASWHGVYGAESPEDTRTNVRMIKMNYILPDFYKTANNEFEGFIIPGDFQGAGINVQQDPRNPWVAPAALDGGCPVSVCGVSGLDTPFPVSINQLGQQLNVSELPNGAGYNFGQSLIFLPVGPTVITPPHTRGVTYGQFYEVNIRNISRTPSNSLENSEFGARYSTLLPIGNGLQASFIYLYEFRDARPEACVNCGPSITGVPGSTRIGPGLFIAPIVHRTYGPGVPVSGTFVDVGETDYRRNSFFGATGTYYDKDLTDIVYRYDVLYQPDHAIGAPNIVTPGQAGFAGSNPTGSAWTQFTRWIIAGDRPTYIPWISKQHTFLTAQYTLTWQPDRPTDATAIITDAGKSREIQNLAFINATNWLMNGQLTTGNLFLWDIDNNVGELSTTNVYRYSRNILLGLNAEWFIGQSGRFTDPNLLSREQRFNELEFTFTYEI
jgi:hypothetical protein